MVILIVEGPAVHIMPGAGTARGCATQRLVTYGPSVARMQRAGSRIDSEV
jgi:hypothetical protein